jgi:hypothetical protein
MRLTERYQNLIRSTDPVERAVAQAQLARLRGVTRRGEGAARLPSRWRHVPLAALFERAGNELHIRPGGTVTTGHEPVHGSKSGACLVVWPAEGRWYCSSCHQGGDAVGAVMSLDGVAYPVAVARLVEGWGAPAGYWRRDGPGGRR